MKHLEIECKWDGNTPRAFERAQRFVQQFNEKIVPQKLNIKDVYLDHANGDLAKQKIALRVRNTDGKWEVTCKTRSEIKNGKAVRREENLPLPRVQNLAQALQFLDREKKWCGLDTSELIVKFTLANRRRVCAFHYDGAELEMALDNVTLFVCGRRVNFKEIETELKRGKPEGLEKFARDFTHSTKLKRAKISKVKTAETLLKLWKK